MSELKYLKNFILFSQMSKEELIEISSLLKKRTYPAGYTLFTQGDRGERVFFLRRGKVKVIRSTPAGNEQILEIIKPGEVFGEVVLFGIESYPATTRTMDEIEVEILTRTDFKNYFKDNPQIGWGMLKVMANKLHRSQKKIENLGLRDTRGRVANLILEMINDFGEKNKMNLNFSQSEMADFIGTSRETVSRTLNEFKKEGLIKINNNHLTITDLEGLKKYL